MKKPYKHDPNFHYMRFTVLLAIMICVVAIAVIACLVVVKTKHRKGSQFVHYCTESECVQRYSVLIIEYM